MENIVITKNIKKDNYLLMQNRRMGGEFVMFSVLIATGVFLLQLSQW